MQNLTVEQSTSFSRLCFQIQILALLVLSVSLPAPCGAADRDAAGAGLPASGSNFGKLPIQFEKNVGQTDSRVKFPARGPGYALFLTPAGAVLSLSKQETTRKRGRTATRHARGASAAPDVVRMNLSGGNPMPGMAAEDELPGKVNYFHGNDPTKWRTNVPTASRVRYRSSTAASGRSNTTSSFPQAPILAASGSPLVGQGRRTSPPKVTFCCIRVAGSFGKRNH
jgi:hypothetical protein